MSDSSTKPGTPSNQTTIVVKTRVSAKTAILTFIVTASAAIGALAVLWSQHIIGSTISIDRVDPLLVTNQRSVPKTGQLVHIYGAGFQQGAMVQFYSHAAQSVRVISSSEITAILPHDFLVPGWYDILIRNPNGQYVIERRAMAVRNASGTVPEKYYVIRNTDERLTYAAEGSVNALGGQGYDNYPNIDVGLYRASPIGATAADKQFAADHYDFGGSIFDSTMKAFNPHFQLFSYAILATLHNQGAEYFTTDPSTVTPGQADTSLTNFCAQRSPACVEDDLLQHYQCDCDASAVNAYSSRCPYGIYTDATKTTKKPLSDYCYQTFNCQNYVQNSVWATIPLRGWNPANAGKKRGVDTFTPNTGCIASTAESPTEARAISTVGYMYPDYWYLPRYNTALLREYGQWLLDTGPLAWHGPPGTVNGVILDLASVPNNWLPATGMEMTDQYFACFHDSSQCQCKTGQACSMDYIQESVVNQANYDLWKTYQDVSTAVKNETTGGQSTWGSVLFPGNIVFPPKLYPKDIYADNTLEFEQDHFVEIYYDGYQNAMNTYQGRCADLKSMNDILKNNGQNLYLNTYGIKDRSAEQTIAGSLNRGKIMSLALYYLMQSTPGASGGITHYSYDSDWNPDQGSQENLSLADAAWNNAVEVNMGTPTALPAGAVDIFGNSNSDGIYNFNSPAGGFICPLDGNDVTTYRNLGSVVYARQYTKGLVLAKERATWSNGDIYSDATRATYQLDGYYRPVQADGTVGAAVNSISLRNSEGAILLRNNAPVFGTLTSQTIPENQQLTYGITATDADGDAVALSATNLPQGATFADQGGGQGLFTWTPTFTLAGQYTVTLTAADFERSTSSALTITVTDTNRAPIFNPVTPQTVAAGSLIAYAVAATDPDGGTVAFSATNLPTGAQLADHNDNTATLRWQPQSAQVGSYTVHVNASDGVATATADIALTVTAGSTVSSGNVRMSPIGIQVVAVNQLLAFSISALATSGRTVTFSATNVPLGASFTDYRDDTATFRWEPSATQIGYYPNIVFTAKDGADSVSETISITVLPNGTGGAYVDSKNFTAFASSIKTGFSITTGNVWGDPREEIIVGTGSGTTNTVRVYSNDGTLRGSFTPYPKTFKGGVRVAACDLNADGTEEIITAPGSGYAPYIRIFNVQGKQILKKQIWTLDKKFKGGLNIACGDLNGDGKGEIIVAASKGGGQVMVHRPDGTRMASFSPYGKSFTGGVTVAVARTASSFQILVGPESGAKPVRRYTAAGKQAAAGFYPYGKTYTGGLALAAGDVDDSGVDSILVAQRSVRSTRVKVYSVGARYQHQFTPYSAAGAFGVSLCVGDVNGDGVGDVVTVPAGKAAATVRMFDGHGGTL